jgi:hypothetical protein
LAPNTTIRIGLFLAVLVGGCEGSAPLGTCDKQADLTGRWTIQAAPFDGDAGVMGDVMPRSFTIEADLKQVKSTSAFNVGHGVWGTLTANDKGVFGELKIPELLKNDGSKTGAALSCTIKINIPIEMPVTDDNLDQGPLRLSLTGKIVEKGMMLGDLNKSLVIMVEDQMMMPRHFAWTATQP